MYTSIPPASSPAHNAQWPSQTAQGVCVNSSPSLLRSKEQADREAGPTLASRCASPAAGQSLSLVGEGGRTKQPAATGLPLSRQLRLEQVARQLLDLDWREPLPAEEEARLCSFFQSLDDNDSSVEQLTDHNLMQALSEHKLNDNGYSLPYLAVSCGMIHVVKWLLNTSPPSFSVNTPFTGENDEKILPLC